MRDMLRLAALGLITGSLLVMLYHAPGPVLRELQLLVCILLLTIVTRSVPAAYGVSALALGMGIVVFLVIGAGYAMASLGLDTTSGFTNWGLIPIVEEALKLAPVAVMAWLHTRRHALTLNPSDLLMLGCFAGAGFALVENVHRIRQAVRSMKKLLRDA